MIWELPPVIAPITFVATTPPGCESLAHQLDELERRQVERHAVGVEGVDHDHVVALVVALQEAPAVVDLDREARVARQLEPAVRGRHDLGIELDGRDLQVVEVAPHALGRGCAPEPDDEDLLRVGLVRQPQVEVVAVEEPRAEGIVEVHAALERAVEAQVARRLVLDDEETVVAGVTRLPDGEPAGDERDLRGVELARRPHARARGRAATSSARRAR